MTTRSPASRRASARRGRCPRPARRTPMPPARLRRRVGRHALEHRPELDDVVARKRVADAQPVLCRSTTPAAWSACRCWDVLALGCSVARAVVDAAWSLGKQVDQLQPARACQSLAHVVAASKTAFLARRAWDIMLYRTFLIPCQPLERSPGGHVFPTTPQRRDSVRLVCVRLQVQGTFAVVDPTST